MTGMRDLPQWPNPKPFNTYTDIALVLAALDRTEAKLAQLELALAQISEKLNHLIELV